MKKWVDRGPEPDAPEGRLHHDPQGERAEQGVRARSRRTSSRPKQTFRYPVDPIDGVPVEQRLDPRSGRRRAAAPVSCACCSPFDWSFIWDNWDALLWGLVRTLKVSAIAIVGAFVIGVLGGAARAYRVPVVSQLAAIYVEVIRNTPILVQIFFLFFGLPQIGITLDAFTVAWLAVMIWGGAYNTENFRAGFEAVP